MKNFFKNIFKSVPAILSEPLIKDILKSNPICSPMNNLERKISDKNGEELYWLNPNNQKCFNFGWFSRQDFIDWTNGIGNIVKGKTDEEKKKFWEVAIFEKKYNLAWAIGYDKKYFHLIDETYKPNYKHSYSCNTTNELPLKITKNNHAEIIGKIMGNVCRYYSDREITVNSHSYRMMREELSGVKETLFMLGIGYYGASNTPCEIENLSWIADICIHKAAYLYYLNNGVEMPDFDFVYNYK